MKRFLLLIPFILPLSLLGQVTRPPGVILVASAPSGACTAGTPGQLVTSTGVIYTCQSSTWAQVGGGGSTGFPIVLGSTSIASGSTTTTLAGLLSVGFSGSQIASQSYIGVSGAKFAGTSATTWPYAFIKDSGCSMPSFTTNGTQLAIIACSTTDMLDLFVNGNNILNVDNSGKFNYQSAGATAIGFTNAAGFSFNNGQNLNAVQGNASKLLAAGTVAGTGATFCTDASGNATTSSCNGTANQAIRAFTMHFNMSDGSVIAGTITGCKRIEYAGTITNWNVYGNVSGSATLAVKSVAFASYTGVAGFSGYTDVTGGGTAPSLTTAVVNSSSSLTSWVTSVAANTIMCVQLTSPASVSTLDVVIQVNAS